MSAAAHTRVGNFLRRIPQPAYVVADGQKLLVPTTGNRWRELGQSIAAIEPNKLVAHSADGTALRAITLETGDSEPKASGAETDSELQTFAKLLSDAYERASKSQQPIIDSAMQFIERLSKRLADTEAELASVRRAYARMIEDQAHERAEAIEASAGASGEAGILDQALAAVAQGALQAQAHQQPAAVAPNGNGHGKRSK